MLPLWEPVSVAVGAKVTLTVHELSAATEVHPVGSNSGLLLETVIDIAAVVLFFTVKVLAALVVPWATEPKAREAGVSVIGATPVPVRVAVCGLPRPVYATVMLPVCALAAVGVKVALTVHVDFAAKEAPQVFVSANGAAVEIVSPDIAVADEFLTVNVDAALVVPSPTEPKLRDAGVIVIGDVPVPVNVTVWVAGEALSVTTTLPVTAPRAVGAKVMVILQLLPAPTDVPQVLVSEKPLPLATTLVTLSAVVVLVFCRVTFELVLVPTASEPNAREVADKVATCACAVSIAAAIRKKRREETRSARVEMSVERNSGFIRSPTKFEMGPGMHATTWLLGRLSPASP